MGNFNDSNVDGFGENTNVDGFGENTNIDGDDNFLSASGKDRRSARQAVKAASKTARIARKDKKLDAKIAQKANRPGIRRTVTPAKEVVSTEEETVVISTDPSSTNVDLPGRDGEMPNMEAIREIAQNEEQPEQPESSDEGSGDDGSADGYGNVDGFGENTNADGDDNVDGFGENTNAVGDEPTIDESLAAGIEDDNFLSASGKLRARIAAKKDTKQAKKDAVVAKKTAKANLVQAKADKKASAPAKDGSKLANVLSIFKKGDSETPGAPPSEGDAPTPGTGMPKGMKAGLWVAAGIAAIALIVTLAKTGKKQAA